MRALVFHLGVIRRLASDRMLESVEVLSTVSGGSLAIALILGRGGQWPASREYEAIFREIQELVTAKSLQLRSLRRLLGLLLVEPSVVFNRARAVSEALRRDFGVTLELLDLPQLPQWILNATCYESGKNWRFSRSEIGDYIIGRIPTPSGFSVADAAAASAAFPGGIGPLVVRPRMLGYRDLCSTGKDGQAELRRAAKLHLWDGGVYDNLGLEPLLKPNEDKARNAELVLVSDASARLALEFRRRRAGLRLVNTATDQVRALRSRMAIAQFSDEHKKAAGSLFRIGQTAGEIFEKAGVQMPTDWKHEQHQSSAEARAAGSLGTTLKRLSRAEFDLLARNGFEVAGATLAAYWPEAQLPSRGWSQLPAR